MARKNSSNSRLEERMFLGDSNDLKRYLESKKKFFESLLKSKKNALNPNQVKKVKSFIVTIEEMLDQKYFNGNRVYSMPEMIEEIKIELGDVKSAIKELEIEVAEAKELAEKAFKAQKSYYANKYEKQYNSPKQVELRELIDEYQRLEYDAEGLEKCRKALWWLLGVIHRPTGFFAKVLE